MKFQVDRSLVSAFGVFTPGEVYDSDDYEQSFYDSLISSGIIKEDFDLLNRQSPKLALDVTLPPYNAKGNGTTDDTQALQRAINDGITQGIPVYLPKGTYRTTTGLTAVGSNVMIYGAGGSLTKIKPDAFTYDTLKIGPGVAGSGIAASGYIRNIDFEGSTSWVTGQFSALKLDGMRQFSVEHITTNRVPIGFDLINNCYGSTFINCRSNLGGIMFNLRTGPQSGSDITFFNCWGRGKDGSIWVSPDAGGFHFYGGQFTGGDNQGADNDLIGVVVLGKDYITGAVGNVANVNFDGIDFEGSKYIHQIRTFGQSILTISNSAFLSTALTTAPEKPLSIFKTTNGQQTRLTLINNVVSGIWKSAKAIDVTGQGSVLNIVEIGTAMVNGTVTFNGVTNGDKTSLLEQSKNPMGTALYRGDSVSKLLLGGMMIRPNVAGTKMEVSYDWGVTWFSLNQTAL
jgi:hypothetical protein